MTADVHALAGAYALNALPDDERAFFERHLAACEACRLEVDELTETAAHLGAAVAEAPPPDLRARVLAAADVTRQLPPEPEPTRLTPQSRVSGQRWLAPVAACLVLVLIALTGVVINLNRRLEGAQVAAAENAEVVAVLAAGDLETVTLDGEVPGSFLFSAEQNRGVLVADNLESPGADKTYELWLIHDGTPVAAGVFEPNEEGGAVRPVEGIVTGAELVAVTIEPEGGSTRPTGSVLSSADL